MRRLEMHDLERADRLVWPEEFAEIDLHAPARAVFTDFRKHEPQVVNAGMKAEEAERLLRQSHVGLKLVVDTDGEFIGVVSGSDLSEANRIRCVADGTEPDQVHVRVRDLMTPRHTLQAIVYSDLEHATVGDLVESLRSHRLRHCLVVDPDAHHIRGLVAASDIARRLNVRIDVDVPPTFAEIHSAVRS